MNNNCKCFHHGVTKTMVVLAWLSAIGFWWSTAFQQSFWWMNGEHFFKDVVILAVLSYISKFCGCCGDTGGSNTCSHGNSCKCGDCGMCK